MPKCMACNLEVLGDYYTCPDHSYYAMCAFHRRDGWPICPSCGNPMHLIRTGPRPEQNPFSGSGEVFGKIALIVGLIILLVLIILFFWFIVSGVLGGVISFIFSWLNKKRRFIKIADHWIFIVAIALIIIFIAIANLVFPLANYIVVGLIGFVIGYWLSRPKKED